MNNKFPIIFLLASIFIFTSCGFKPMYKISDLETDFRNYNVKIVSAVSREIRDEVRANIFPKNNAAYEVLLQIDYDQTPLIINTNGTVAKYRIEVKIDFEIIELSENETINLGTTRGFAQYDVRRIRDK